MSDEIKYRGLCIFADAGIVGRKRYSMTMISANNKLSRINPPADHCDDENPSCNKNTSRAEDLKIIQLPEGALSHIFRSLAKKDLASMRHVCKTFRSAADDKSLLPWRRCLGHLDRDHSSAAAFDDVTMAHKLGILPNVESIGLHSCDDESLKRFVAVLSSDPPRNLKNLSLCEGQMSLDTVRGLMSVINFGALERLQLCDFNLDDLRIQEIFGDTSFNRLEYFCLNENILGPAGGQAIFNAIRLAPLNDLRFCYTGLGDFVASALNHATYLTNLQTLNLDNSDLTIDGLTLIARVNQLSSLTWLRISENSIGPSAGQALAHDTHLRSIRYLDLISVSLEAAGIRSLVTASWIDQLTKLKLAGCDIGDDGARALAVTTSLKELRSLNLYSNGITDIGMQSFAQATHFLNLKSLDLGNNQIGRLGVQSFVFARFVPALVKLSLSDNLLDDFSSRYVEDVFRRRQRV